MFVHTVQYLQRNSFVKLLYSSVFVFVRRRQEGNDWRWRWLMCDGGGGRGSAQARLSLAGSPGVIWRHYSYAETVRNWPRIMELVYYDNDTSRNRQLLGQTQGRASDRRGGAQTNLRKFSISLLDRCRGIFQAPVSVAVDRHNRIHR